MSVPICPKCNIPMVYKKGVDKNGKPYAFWGCPNFPACKETYNPPKPTGKEVNFQQELEEEKIAQRVKEKRENIAWLNAKTNAVSLIANHPAYKDLTPEQIKEKLPLLTYWLYKLTAERAEIKIEEGQKKTGEEGQREIVDDSDEIREEEIPF